MPYSFLIPQPANFSFRECLWFLDRGFDDCLHRIFGLSVLKLIRQESSLYLISISEHQEYLEVRLLAGDQNTFNEGQCRSFVEEWFDLSRDMKPFKRAVANDPILSKLVGQYWGLRLMSIPDLFEALCWSIIGQQINLRFAYKMKRSLVEKTGDKLTLEGFTYYIFPTPGQLLQLSYDDLKRMQFSTQKANYVMNVAALFDRQEISKSLLSEMPDTRTILHELTKIKGIGDWTANYVAMKCLRRMDAVTYGDSGLIQAFKNLKNLNRRPERGELESFFSLYPAWEAYVVFYLWRSLS